MNLQILYHKVFHRKKWNELTKDVEKGPDGNRLTVGTGLSMQATQILISEMTKLLDMYKASNFVTMIVVNPRTLAEWELTVRRPDGISPAERIGQLEERIAFLENELEELRAEELSL